MSRNNPRSNPRPRKPPAPKAPTGLGEGSPSRARPPAPAPAPAHTHEEPGTALALSGSSESMRLIRSAVRHRWVIPDALFTAAPAIVGRILLDPGTDIRDKIRATQTLAMLDRNNAELILESHRIERLQEGSSTDNVAVVASLSDEQIAAVAKTILPPKAKRKS